MKHRIILDYDDEMKGFTLSWTGGEDPKNAELFDKMMEAGDRMFSMRIAQMMMIGPNPVPPPMSRS